MMTDPILRKVPYISMRRVMHQNFQGLSSEESRLSQRARKVKGDGPVCFDVSMDGFNSVESRPPKGRIVASYEPRPSTAIRLPPPLVSSSSLRVRCSAGGCTHTLYNFRTTSRQGALESLHVGLSRHSQLWGTRKGTK